MRNKFDLKRLYIDERPELKQYLNRIGFSLDQVISIESCRVDDSLIRYNFKGMGFVFAVETVSDYSFFKPHLQFNEIQIESQAG